MFTQESAEKFARQLESDWELMEMQDFLPYFTDDVEYMSSNLQRFISESNGRLTGKKTLQNFWEYMRTKFPYSSYKLHEINPQGNCLHLTFFNATENSYSRGQLWFNEDLKIYKVIVSYV